MTHDPETIDNSLDTAESGTVQTVPRVFALSFSGPGVVVAFAFFSLSLFASLLPRTGLFQGLVSGITVMIGYGIGVAGQWAWNYVGLPKAKGRTRKIVVGILLGIVGFMTLSAMWHHVGWQNDVRSIFGMDPISPIVWLTIFAVTIPVAALILIIARSLRRLFNLFARWLDKLLSKRLSRLIGGVAMALLVWLPVYENGRTVRFTGAENALDEPSAEWQHTKIIYLQHASDPVVNFSQDLAFSMPDWLLEGQRGPDISDKMVWIPIVTMWQVALDLPAAGSVPFGFGHMYSMESNSDSWVALTGPSGWSEADSATLNAFLSGIEESAG